MEDKRYNLLLLNIELARLEKELGLTFEGKEKILELVEKVTKYNEIMRVKNDAYSKGYRRGFHDGSNIPEQQKDTF